MTQTSLLLKILLMGPMFWCSAVAQEVSAGSWEYGRDGSGDATRLHATVAGKVDDGASATLTFYDSEIAGRQAHVALPFLPDCVTGCRVALSLDGATVETVRATILPTSDTTLTLRNARNIWRNLDNAQVLEIAITAEGGAKRHAVFKVGGFDVQALPGWK
ncbi:hypothetical protein FPY71_04905 [Aureimonas fodinaquatilis]|uniref:Invasion associated locus B family protein n=1 Tax=Aureimonas fodinaquatilis TaxID=2565783 RepID=A0A5B0E0T4_9HYPH|nr:hypothetical protein [Aureimonas fodinaquatilis]KAA0972433.1 hypothetical protein FPY71_04905 [Aureimonas fodinaquatilis]